MLKIKDASVFTGSIGVSRPGRGVRMAVCITLAAFFACFPADAPEAKEARTKGIGLLEAVQSTIAEQPNILIREQQKEAAYGEMQAASGSFDHTLGASAGYDHQNVPYASSLSPDVQIDSRKLDTTSFKMNMTRQLRNGVSIGPELSLMHTAPEKELWDGAENSKGSINFVINIPLLKGLGTEATGAAETAAQKQYEASRLDLRHMVSTSVQNTLSAYWSYLAARQNLDVLKKTETRAERLVKNTRALIREDEVAAAEIETVLANRAAKAGSRIDAEQRLVDAKTALGLAMGLSYGAIDALGLPSDIFPEPDADKLKRLGSLLEGYRTGALASRADYLALQKKEEAAKVLVTAAENNLLPNLNLKLNAGYTGMMGGDEYAEYHEALYRNVPGVNAGFLLSWEWPVENNKAKGLLRQQASLHRQALITLNNNGRTTLSGVSRSLSELKSSADGLLRYRKSVAAYRTAAENEKKKALLGMATLLDILNTEDRLTSAVISEISAKLKYANAIASLRYETGTLVQVNPQGGFSVSPGDLVSIPPVSDHR